MNFGLEDVPKKFRRKGTDEVWTVSNYIIKLVLAHFPYFALQMGNTHCNLLQILHFSSRTKSKLKVQYAQERTEDFIDLEE